MIAPSVSVSKGKGGIWECRLYLGRNALGKPIRPYKRFPNASSEAEALELARTWAANLTANGTVRSAKLADLLCDYVDLRERNGASPNSIRSYRLFVRYVSKYIGRADARSVTVMDMNRFEQKLLQPKDEGGAGLSRNSVLAVHQFLRGAYNHFVDAGICDTNPMVLVTKPSPERHEASFVTEWDFAALSDAIAHGLDADMSRAVGAREAACAFASWLSLVTGMRVGEICALRRRDIDRARMFVHVGGNVVEQNGSKPVRRDVTKGRKCRNVSITAHDLKVIDGIAARQDAAFGRLNASAPLVTCDGSVMRPTDVSRMFSAMRDACGLPRSVTFHSLRHTHASWLIANGCDIKTVSERLGHADEATTLRIYAHMMPGRDAAAAQIFNDAMARLSCNGL